MSNSIDSVQGAANPLSDAEYRKLSDSALAYIEATVDCWLQDDLADIDTQRTGGLLELAFPNGSKIIINTQPPLHELWMAARSGGYHYRYVQGGWRDTRDGSDFFDVLSSSASEQAGVSLHIAAPV